MPLKFTRNDVYVESMPESNKLPGPKIVVLKEVPPGLLSGLPASDQVAISRQRGRPVQLVGYDEDGRAELEFTDVKGHLHTIWVHPSCVEHTTGGD